MSNTHTPSRRAQWKEIAGRNPESALLLKVLHDVLVAERLLKIRRRKLKSAVEAQGQWMKPSH